ncbi:MAG: hypothetical protein KGJ31_02680 [Patescibacteria group bacterium]|nr:hypothetical protein [Patescibacteria group bacterium]
MRRAVILQHGPSTGIHGQLANQLWNFISVYAYAKERDIPVSNYSFFEYSRHFSIPVGSPLVDLFFFKPFNLLVTLVPGKIIVPLWRKLYKAFVLIVGALAPQSIVRSGNAGYVDAPYYLPPSPGVREEFLRKENIIPGTLYFDGWLFRNPTGIEKHRESIREYFSPKKNAVDNIRRFLSPLRTKYRHVIGVHIRQGDYRTWKGGKYFVPQKRVREVIDDYTAFAGIDAKDTCFVIASDGPIDAAHFAGLYTAISKAGAIEDLFLLAQTDAVIGSDSSFGDFSAYYGNIPHIVLENEPIDWEYYRGKARYFENKYCTLVHY